MPAKKINEAPPLTRTQCAALLDMDVSYFYRITKADDTIIRTDTVGGRGRGSYPAREFGHWLRKRLKHDIGITEDGEVYDDKIEKARLLHHQANNEALKERTSTAELLPADEVLKTWTEMITAMRAKLLGLPSRLANRVMSFDTVIEAEQYVKDEVYRALRELGEQK